MKALMMGLLVFSCAFVARGEVFQMDRKGETTVEVKKSADEYRVVCKFRPQTKFDKAVNAKFNDAKGDSLCKKALARYLKVSAHDTLMISGQYSAAPVETVGERLRYSFGVPISGCKVSKAETKQELTATKGKSAAVASIQPQTTTNVAPVQGAQELKQEKPAQPKSVNAARSSSYVCVAKYKEVNGKRMTISKREYQRQNFKTPKEFDQFCQQEFARIRALGDANLRAVRDFGK